MSKVIRTLLFIILFLTFHRIVHAKESPHADYLKSASRSYGEYSVPLDKELYLGSFLEMVQTRDLRTIEEVIQELPNEMLNLNYVMMYRSRSLQDASPMAPRVITYSPSARFVLSFNGEPEQAGYNTIEMIQFNEETLHFEFYELEFSNTDRPALHGPNPTKCMECHQSPSRSNVDLRPNWEPYSIWPGAYGSAALLPTYSRILIESKSFMDSKARPEDREFLEEQARERELLSAFLQNVKSEHPRYRHLGELNLKSPTTLTQQLANLNFLRVGRLMMEQENYPSHEAFLMAYAKCSMTPEELETRYLSWHMQQEIPFYYDYSPNRRPDLNYQKCLDSYTEQRMENYGLSEGDVRNRCNVMHLNPGARQWDPLSTSELITWLFEPFGIDTSDWSMDFRTRGRFAFRERFGTPSNPWQNFKSAYRRAAEFLRPNEYNKLNAMECSELKELAHQNLQAFVASEEPQRIRESHPSRSAPTAADVVNRCMNCHNGQSDFAPLLEYDNPDWLRTNLANTGYPRGTLYDEILYRTGDMARERDRMPLSGALTPDERDVFIQYLNSFLSD